MEDTFEIAEACEAGAASDGKLAKAVSAQYARTDAAVGSAVCEMVVFGAMLEAVDKRLAERNAKRKVNTQYGGGESLKGWLEKHCPEVDYKTAYNYLAAARGTRALAKVADDVPLLPLMGETAITDAQMAAYRDKVMAVLQKSSLRVLRGAAPSRKIRLASQEAAKPLQMFSEADRAANKWCDILMVSGDRYAMDSIRDLDREKARSAYNQLQPLVAALKRRMEEED